MKITTFLRAIEVGGTIAFTLSGLIEAMRKRMDVVGVFSVAFVSAFGVERCVTCCSTAARFSWSSTKPTSGWFLRW